MAAFLLESALAARIMEEETAAQQVWRSVLLAGLRALAHAHVTSRMPLDAHT